MQMSMLMVSRVLPSLRWTSPGWTVGHGVQGRGRARDGTVDDLAVTGQGRGPHRERRVTNIIRLARHLAARWEQLDRGFIGLIRAHGGRALRSALAIVFI